MSQRSAAMDAFLDQEAAVAAVTCYASALDARDWTAYRALFIDAITIDYGAIGSLVAMVPADEWTNRQDGWKIAGVSLTVIAYPAGKEAFDAAFAAARAIFAEGNSR